MSYSAIGIIAAVILLIINHDVLFGRKNDRFFAVGPIYRRFIFAILAYYITDVLWGFFDQLKWGALLYADTVLYFIAMALTILFWTQYVIAYLNEKSVFSVILKFIGIVFVGVELLFIALNFFKPGLIFSFDTNGVYSAGPARYVALAVQIALYLLCLIYTLAFSARHGSSEKRHRRTIGLFGVTMILLIAIQYYYPLLPLYSVGYMVGTCLLYSFVVQDERDEYRRVLESALNRERKQKKELGSTRKLAYTDPLTGIKNKLSYAEAEERLQARIDAGEAPQFAIAVFDLNGLKKTNDTLGHEAGDKFIIDACRLICLQFKHSPVFRIGGDEFAAILEGSDFEDRYGLMKRFNRQIEENLRCGDVVIAAGAAQFDPDENDDCITVFKRADRAMYDRKLELKKMGSVIRE